MPQPENQRRNMRFMERPDDVANALEEIAGDAFNAEQLRQLCRCDVKRGAGLEADQNGVRMK